MTVESSERVLLKGDPQRWKTMPSDIQEAIHRGVERARAIRRDILATALVTELPPVHVLDVALRAPNSAVILGMAGAVEHHGTFELGVELPAPTVLYASDAVLRGVIVHEFAHCFCFARKVIEATLRGEEAVVNFGSVYPTDDEDREWLDRPELWFAPSDVASFLFHSSPALDATSEAIYRSWPLAVLDVGPEPRITGSIMIPAAISDRIRRSSGSP